MGRGGGGGAGVGALVAGGGGAGVGADGALDKVDIIVSSLSVQFCHETVSPTVTVVERGGAVAVEVPGGMIVS